MSLARAATSGADAPVADASVKVETAGTERVLSDDRIRELAKWREDCVYWEDRAYWPYSSADITSRKLDAELRAILRREVGPDRVEVEFARVLRMR
jgi:hypothetical protein